MLKDAVLSDERIPGRKDAILMGQHPRSTRVPNRNVTSVACPMPTLEEAGFTGVSWAGGGTIQITQCNCTAIMPWLMVGSSFGVGVANPVHLRVVGSGRRPACRRAVASRPAGLTCEIRVRFEYRGRFRAAGCRPLRLARRQPLHAVGPPPTRRCAAHRANRTFFLALSVKVWVALSRICPGNDGGARIRLATTLSTCMNTLGLGFMIVCSLALVSARA